MLQSFELVGLAWHLQRSYPLGWLLVAWPLADRVMPSMLKVAIAAASGVGLWIFALYIMAHLVVGMPAFLGFMGIT